MSAPHDPLSRPPQIKIFYYSTYEDDTWQESSWALYDHIWTPGLMFLPILWPHWPHMCHMWPPTTVLTLSGEFCSHLARMFVRPVRGSVKNCYWPHCNCAPQLPPFLDPPKLQKITIWPIALKLSEYVDIVKRTHLWNFCDDPAPDADCGSVWMRYRLTDMKMYF